MSDDTVGAGFSELERKLEALERELQGAGHPPQPDLRADEIRVTAPAGNGRGAAHRERESSFVGATTPSATSSRALQDRESSATPSTTDTPRSSHAFVASPPLPPRATIDPAPAVESAPAATTDAARALGDARTELGGLRAHLDELVRFREQLERSANEVIEEYDRLLAGLRVAADREQATRAGDGLDATVLDGLLTVDAGPFEDVAGLAELERALGGLPGVRDVHVRSFERSRALVDVILGEPVAFGSALRRVFALAFSLTRAAPGHVTVELG